MINPALLGQEAALLQQFVTAKPFKHLCIDGFFDAASADAALAEFPEFEREYALNEFGEVGGKAVRTDLNRLSPFYRRLHDYLGSVEFLSFMTRITGVADLRIDPHHYGGGTHENLHGQELDPHIDFNYDSRSRMHRRLNLLLYLNKEWHPSWGGNIELHSNPRRPDEDEVRSFLPIFNRAVIFETNEISWHGFEVIDLPADKRHLSRKCISIYLYTLDRPPHEIAPAHGTFYVQRPLPARIRAGHTLSPEDVRQIQILITRRDGWIEHYRKQESSPRRIDANSRAIAAAIGAERPQEESALAPLSDSEGIYPDRWVGEAFSTRLRALKPLSHLLLQIYIPEQFGDGLGVEFAIDGVTVERVTAPAGIFVQLLAVDIPEGGAAALTIRAERTYCPHDSGSADERHLAFVLDGISGVTAEESQLPLGGKFVPGYTLGERDVIELREILRRRDRLIEACHRREVTPPVVAPATRYGRHPQAGR